MTPELPPDIRRIKTGFASLKEVHSLQRRLLLLLTALPLMGRIALAGDPGTTSANFLKLGIGPRAVAMGEAQVGLADDVYATYWNPAGLSRLPVQQAGFVHTRYVEDISAQYAAYAYPHATLGTFAGSYTHLGIKKFDAYDATGQPNGKVGAGDSAFAFSYARPLLKNKRYSSELSAGITGKYIQQKLDRVTASAYAADLGLFYAPGRRWGSLLKGWKAGAALRNLGTGVKFDEESFPLPRSFSAGLSWSGKILGESLTLALDGTQPNDGDMSIGAGAELWTLGVLVLRGGYTSRGDLGNGLRAGAGIRFKVVQVDYAFAGYGDFGNAHRIGLTLSFGREPQNPQSQAQEWFEKGQHSFKRKRYTEALVEFNNALEMDPAHPQALDMMKKTHEALKHENPL